MKNVLLLLTILLVISGCKKKEDPTPVRKLKNCAVEYLNFMDDNKYYSNPSMHISFPTVSFKYLDDKLIQTKGGFIAIPDGSNFTNIVFVADAYDSIVYTGYAASVYSKPKAIYSFMYDVFPENPTIYSTNSDGRLSSMTRRDGYKYTYTYLGNQVIEKNSAGKTLRNFYFENNNLVSVTSEYGDTSLPFYSKKEILFQDFDTHPNPLKNMYHFSGAFYRAFSENNYSKYTVNIYGHLDTGKIGITSTSWFSMPIIYETDGYPKFGEYEPQ